MTEVRLCRNCRFVWIDPEFSRDSIDRLEAFAMLAECRHPTAREEDRINLVSGYIKVRWKSCSWHREPRDREGDNNCGPGARWFEPKEPPEPLEVAGDDPGPRSGGAMAEPE